MDSCHGARKDAASWHAPRRGPSQLRERSPRSRAELGTAQHGQSPAQLLPLFAQRHKNQAKPPLSIHCLPGALLFNAADGTWRDGESQERPTLCRAAIQKYERFRDGEPPSAGTSTGHVCERFNIYPVPSSPQPWRESLISCEI